MEACWCLPFYRLDKGTMVTLTKFTPRNNDDGACREVCARRAEWIDGIVRMPVANETIVAMVWSYSRGCLYIRVPPRAGCDI